MFRWSGGAEAYIYGRYIQMPPLHLGSTSNGFLLSLISNIINRLSWSLDTLWDLGISPFTSDP